MSFNADTCQVLIVSWRKTTIRHSYTSTTSYNMYNLQCTWACLSTIFSSGENTSVTSIKTSSRLNFIRNNLNISSTCILIKEQNFYLLSDLVSSTHQWVWIHRKRLLKAWNNQICNAGFVKTTTCLDPVRQVQTQTMARQEKTTDWPYPIRYPIEK